MIFFVGEKKIKMNLLQPFFSTTTSLRPFWVVGVDSIPSSSSGRSSRAAAAPPIWAMRAATELLLAGKRFPIKLVADRLARTRRASVELSFFSRDQAVAAAARLNGQAAAVANVPSTLRASLLGEDDAATTAEKVEEDAYSSKASSSGSSSCSRSIVWSGVPRNFLGLELVESGDVDDSSPPREAPAAVQQLRTALRVNFGQISNLAVKQHNDGGGEALVALSLDCDVVIQFARSTNARDAVRALQRHALSYAPPGSGSSGAARPAAVAFPTARRETADEPSYFHPAQVRARAKRARDVAEARRLAAKRARDAGARTARSWSRSLSALAELRARSDVLRAAQGAVQLQPNAAVEGRGVQQHENASSLLVDAALALCDRCVADGESASPPIAEQLRDARSREALFDALALASKLERAVAAARDDVARLAARVAEERDAAAAAQARQLAQQQQRLRDELGVHLDAMRDDFVDNAALGAVGRRDATTALGDSLAVMKGWLDEAVAEGDADAIESRAATARAWCAARLTKTSRARALWSEWGTLREEMESAVRTVRDDGGFQRFPQMEVFARRARDVAFASHAVESMCSLLDTSRKKMRDAVAAKTSEIAPRLLTAAEEAVRRARVAVDDVAARWQVWIALVEASSAARAMAGRIGATPPSEAASATRSSDSASCSTAAVASEAVEASIASALARYPSSALRTRLDDAERSAASAIGRAAAVVDGVTAQLPLSDALPHIRGAVTDCAAIVDTLERLRGVRTTLRQLWETAQLALAAAAAEVPRRSPQRNARAARGESSGTAETHAAALAVSTALDGVGVMLAEALAAFLQQNPQHQADQTATPTALVPTTEAFATLELGVAAAAALVRAHRVLAEREEEVLRRVRDAKKKGERLEEEVRLRLVKRAAHLRRKASLALLLRRRRDALPLTLQRGGRRIASRAVDCLATSEREEEEEEEEDGDGDGERGGVAAGGMLPRPTMRRRRDQAEPGRGGGGGYWNSESHRQVCAEQRSAKRRKMQAEMAEVEQEQEREQEKKKKKMRKMRREEAEEEVVMAAELEMDEEPAAVGQEAEDLAKEAAMRKFLLRRKSK